MTLLGVILTFVGLSLFGIIGTGYLLKVINDSDPTNREGDNERTAHAHDH